MVGAVQTELGVLLQVGISLKGKVIFALNGLKGTYKGAVDMQNPAPEA